MKSYGQPDFKRTMDRIFMTKSGKAAIVDHITENKAYRYSYGRLKKMINEVGEILKSAGIAPAERIAVLTKPSAKTAIMLLALSYLGYTAVIPDTSLPAEEQERLLEFTEPSAIITSDELYSNISDELKAKVPVYRMFEKIKYSKILELLNKGLKKRVKPDIKGDRDVIAILFSSGTTGSFKGAEVTYQAMIYAAKMCVHYSFYSYTPTFLHILPMSHVAGYTIMHVCYLNNVEMGFVPEISAAGLAMGLKCQEPSHFIMIPKVFETIHKKIEAEIAKRPIPVRAVFSASRKLSSFVRKKTGYRMRWLMRPFFAPAVGRNMHVIGCGTGACDPETVKFFLDMGIDFLNVYGSTEASFPISGVTIHQRYPDTGAGKYNEYPFIDIRIEDGEIVVKSPLVMKGYFRDPESTRNAFTTDGYLKTGDLGYIDKDDNLQITGRRKETIQLRNGNKVSASDVDRYYQAVSGDVRIAACGVPDADLGTEHIVLFVETNGADEREINKVTAKIRKRSDSNSGSYHLSDIICIPEFPQTSLGKIKRFKLKEIAQHKEEKQTSSTALVVKKQLPTVKKELPCTEGVCAVISKYTAPGQSVAPDMKLAEDLNLDSITMFEICSELQTAYGTDFMDKLGSVVTVKDLADLINNGSRDLPAVKKSLDLSKYPLQRTFIDRRLLGMFMRLSRKLYDFEVIGAEELPSNSHYIFCPNHESHFDGLWVFTALQGHLDCTNIACLAKQEHMDHSASRSMVRILGGIPIDRSGNPAPALKQAIKVLRRTNTQFLVHPEGTRTRTGAMGKFKKGVAQLSIDSGVPLVPVCIIGAYQIYPADKALPKLYNFKEHKRMPLKIIFGTPIYPQDSDTAESLTEKLQSAVQELRAGKGLCIHENRNRC